MRIHKPIIAIALLAIVGCVNIGVTRNPFTSVKIEHTYQSTFATASVAWIISFPQLISDNPSDYSFKVYNAVTVPLGALCLADAFCESVIDTVCWPVDHYIAKSRNK